jgi:nucleoside diphosphate kinase
MVWEGDGVIAAVRLMIGATKPLEAAPSPGHLIAETKRQ